MGTTVSGRRLLLLPQRFYCLQASEHATLGDVDRSRRETDLLAGFGRGDAFDRCQPKARQVFSWNSPLTRSMANAAMRRWYSTSHD